MAWRRRRGRITERGQLRLDLRSGDLLGVK
jgi:hypothetical protein